MAKYSSKIKEYCKANNINSVDFLSDVILQDDGQGVYIREWNLNIAKPTNEQLSSYETQANEAEINFQNHAVTGNQKLLDLGLTQAEATALTGYIPPAAE